MGSIPDRVLQAFDIYNNGLTFSILIVNNTPYGIDFLSQHGVSLPTFASLSKQTLIQLGISDSLITILPGGARSTSDEAKITAAWLKHNPEIDTIIIVTSPAHTRRAIMIFHDTFIDNDLDICLLSSPSQYSDFNAQKWYTDRESAKQVFLEYTKLASFLLVEQWQ